MKFSTLKTSQQGMSLIEILIVISLIAVAGSFVAGQFFDRLQEGNQQAAKIQMNNFKSLLEDYRRYCQTYPTEAQGLEALIAKPASAPDCPSYPAGAFIKDGKLPADPWATPYLYQSADEGRTFVITSYGRDRKEGGEGFDRDIKSNE